jgi:hypothetical protein
MAQHSTVSTPMTYDRRPVTPAPSRLSVAEVVDALLRAADDGEVRDAEGRPLAPEAVHDLHWALGGYLGEALGRRKLREIPARRLQQLLDDLERAGVPRRRLRRIVTALGTLYRYAGERGLVHGNAAERLIVAEEPEPRRPPRADRVVARALEAATAGFAMAAAGLLVATALT